MNVTEDLVRRSLLAHEAEAPDDSGLLVSVRAGVARQRRLQWARVAGAAAAAVAVIAGASVVADGPSRGPGRADPPAASPSFSIPAGAQPVSFHGVTVFVPAQWKLNAVDCGTPVEDTVLLDPLILFCRRMGPAPQVSVVELRRLTPAALREVRIRLPEERRLADVRVFTDLGVLVSARSLDHQLVRRVLDSAQETPIDAFGCRDRAQSLKPTAKPSHPGAAVNLVPGSPRSATICRYEGDWLARSVRVPPNQLATLTGILNRLPAGRSRPGPNTSASARSLEEDRHRGFVVQFTYAGRPRLDVYVHIGDRDLTAANGARTTKIDEPLVTTLLSLVGYDGGYPNPREYR